ncbi:hypothetical protein Xcel_2869 [Xylanimonas cellulosilytica DSM 15894]|uniref:RloB-like protein n=1 Tax=Xylanimonas cellulosilytica (strain DSM 15894 / JCM 12276 / CECT 5975 / KCTC 9989 / LMG 20990 / NBRC 107835 / XIL07) TaxID=446471 RepID=D1BYL0_XYLCX|nr:RloB family protein [Xylanimonas cellulosilytica]ACZ31882.1 hypothetical protein Xcel_2869 [Xylanimonas cellulosilytica DSM 15894]
MGKPPKRAIGAPRNTRRASGERAARARVLVVVGGKRTEDDYFRWVNQQIRGVNVRVVSKGRDPRGLLEEATRLRDEERATARRADDASNVYDAVWVVTDVDDFARDLAQLRGRRLDGIALAISNPCFEVWLVAHVDPNPKAAGAAVRGQARELGLVSGNDGKAPLLEQIAGRFAHAERTALRLRAQHAGVSEFPADAPSTNVDMVVRDLLDRAASSGMPVEDL